MTVPHLPSISQAGWAHLLQPDSSKQAAVAAPRLLLQPRAPASLLLPMHLVVLLVMVPLQPVIQLARASALALILSGLSAELVGAVASGDVRTVADALLCGLAWGGGAHC